MENNSHENHHSSFTFSHSFHLNTNQTIENFRLKHMISKRSKIRGVSFEKELFYATSTINRQNILFLMYEMTTFPLF